MVQQLRTGKRRQACEGNYGFSLVSSFALQVERLRKFSTGVFIFTVRDGDDAAFADHRAIECDRADLRQRFVFDTVADDLIVNPNHCGKRTNGEWTTLDGHAPGFINCNLLSADLDVQVLRQAQFLNAITCQSQIAVWSSRLRFAYEFARQLRQLAQGQLLTSL